MLYNELGRKRLAMALKASAKLQGGLSLRDMSLITRQINEGLGLGVGTIQNLTRGYTEAPEDGTLERLAPLIFQIQYWEVVNNQGIGKPIFKYTGAEYSERMKQSLLIIRSTHDLPDLQYRCIGAASLKKILSNEVPVIAPVVKPKQQTAIR